MRRRSTGAVIIVTGLVLALRCSLFAPEIGDVFQSRDEGGLEVLRPGLFAQQRGDAPVFFGDKGLDFCLAVADQPEGNRLHATGAGARLDAPPEQGADFVSHESVEHAASLLRIEQVFIDLARPANGLLHSTFGNLVEDGATRVLQAERLLERPGDKFSFSVGVWRQVDLVGAARRCFQFIDQFALFLDDFILRGEVFARIHAQTLLGQIDDMPH